MHDCEGPGEARWWQTDEGAAFASACRQIAFLSGIALGSVHLQVTDYYEMHHLDQHLTHAEYAERVVLSLRKSQRA